MNTRPPKNPPQTATSDSQPAPRGWRLITRQLARIFFFLFAALFLLFVISLLVIRSSWAEKHLTAEIPDFLNPLLAEQGLFLEFDQLSGPLPSRLALSGLRLHDQNGLFLEIENIETRLALGELFSGALTIDIFQVASPTLHRLPDLIPAGQEEPITEPTSQPTGLALDLPIDIRLKNFTIEGASILWATLGLEPQEISASSPAEQEPEVDNQIELAEQEKQNKLPDKTDKTSKPDTTEQIKDTGNTGQTLAMQTAWQQTLAKPLRLDVKASAELSHGILNAAVNLRARDYDVSPQNHHGENFDLRFALTPAHFILIEADHNSAEVSGNLALTLGGTSYNLNLESLAEVTDTTARLTELSLEGLGLSLQSSAEFLLEAGKPKATLALASSEMDDLINLLSALTGEAPERLKPILSPVAIDLEVNHTAQSLDLDLRKFHVGGVHAVGQATLENIFATSDPLQPQGNLAKAESAPDSDKSALASNAPPLAIHGKLALEVAALEALSPEVQGSLQGTVDVQGSLADLRSTLTLASPNLTTTSGDLHNFIANITASLKEDKTGQRALQGALTTSATPNPLGPTDIRLDWAALIPPADEAGLFVSPVTASIQQMRVNIFGLALEGALSASLSPDFLHSPVPTESGESGEAGQTGESAQRGNIAQATEATQAGDVRNFRSTSNTSGVRSVPSPAAVTELLWPEGLSLDGHIEASVKDWNPLSLFAQTPLSGKNTSFAVSLRRKGNGQEATVSALSDSFSVPAQGFALAGLDLKANALVPSQTGKLPALALSLATGQGEVADIPWKAITANVADEGGKGVFSLSITQDSQKILHKKAVAAQKGKGGDTLAGNGQSPHPASSAQTSDKGPATSFTSKLNKDELIALQGQYHLRDMRVTLEKLALKEPFSQTEIQLRNAASIAFNDGLYLEGLTLDVSSGGSITAEISQTENAMLAKADLSSLPLRFLNDVAGTTLPPGHINADLFIQTGQKAPQGTVNLQLYLDKRGQRVTSSSTSPTPPANSRQTAQNTVSQKQIEQSQADVHLQANIVQSGGRSYLAGGLDFSRLAGQTAQTGRTGTMGQAPQREQTGQPLAAPLTFTIPLSNEGGLPLPDVNGPFQANLRWQGPLDGFWQLVPLPDTEFSALASIDLGLSGTLAAPKTGGTAYVAQGHIYDKGLGLLLTNLALEAHASHNEEYRLVFAAEDGDKGSIGLEGALQLKGVPTLDLRGQLKRLAPLHRDDVKVTLTGLLGAKGPLDALKVTADILVERGEIELLAAMGNGSVQTLPITDQNATLEEASGDGGELDVTVTIPKRFYIRGLGLDSEWQGKLAINGAFAEPQIIGSLSPVRGYFELISKPFAFTGGEIIFAGGSKINPGLGLELTYTTNELEAIIKAGGSLEKPELDLQSKPPLPKDEVLAHVLFGKKISELSRFEALQLANSMSELAGISSGNLNPLTSMRKATGLDVLRFGSDDDSPDQRQDSGMTGASNLGNSKGNGNGDSATESAPTLEAGKYINDSIYIGVEQGMTQESTGVRVEIELFPNTTLQGKSTANSSSAGIGWKMDY